MTRCQVLLLAYLLAGCGGALGAGEIRGPAGCKAVEGAKPGAGGYAGRALHEKRGIELVLVTAGQFTMGATGIHSDSLPPHAVTIPKPFYIGRTEVRNDQYRRFVEATGYDGNKTKREKMSASPNPIHRHANRAWLAATSLPLLVVAVYLCEESAARSPQPQEPATTTPAAAPDAASAKAGKPNAAGLSEMAGIAAEKPVYLRNFEGAEPGEPMQLWYEGPGSAKCRVVSQGVDHSVGFGGSKASYRVELNFGPGKYGAIYLRFPVRIPIWSDMTLQWRIKAESEPQMSLGGRHGLSTGWAGGTDGNTAFGYGRKVEGPDRDGWELWQASVVCAKVDPAEYIFGVSQRRNIGFSRGSAGSELALGMAADTFSPVPAPASGGDGSSVSTAAAAGATRCSVTDEARGTAGSPLRSTARW